LEEVLLEELDQLRPGPATSVDVKGIQAKPQMSFSAIASGAARNLIVGSTDEAPPAPNPDDVSDEFACKLFRQQLTALCLSGGGIRSASISLGILQALAQRKLLSGFDYLSTVSGGGYIGSWLTAWRSREGQSIATVEQALACKREPKEVTNLRDFTSYLIARRGLTSSDTWAGIATIFRNLALNWTLFLPLFLLLVWIPKASILLLELGRNWVALGEGSTPLGLGSRAWWLLTGAAVLYVFAELFISRQLIFQEQQSGFRRPPYPYGAGQLLYLFFGFVPIYAAACLTSVVLIHGPETLNSWTVLFEFALAGALLWGVPFLIASRWRLDWLLLARIFSGAGFAVVLALAFALVGNLASLEDDRYVVVLSVSGFFFAHLVGGILFAGLSSRLFDRDAVREWTARAGGWFIASALVWTVYATLVLWDPHQDWPQDWPHIDGWMGKLVNGLVASMGGIAGLGAALFGHSKSTPAGEAVKPSDHEGIDWNRVAVAAALFFIAVLIFELSRAFDWVVLVMPLAALTKTHDLSSYSIRLGIGAPVILVVWAAAASYFINVNKFSLHAYYRNRLIRSYLGASNIDRRPSAFTGFDEGDNPKMGDLPAGKPIHVVNIALNLVHGKRLAWQERKASSFTVTPRAVGNPSVGYRPVAKYGNKISLGTAMAISGAAVSPNMGYHSSRPLALLMTLFNVRLGWWLGNPARAAWTRAGPLQAVLPFVMELFGLTDDEQRFVYLSDGGHFENLGIYEMFRRRCRTIVAVDAGCDPDFKFEDLGDAIRKARIDFGVEVRFSEPCSPASGCEPMRLGLINRPNISRPSPYCAIGTIRYPGIQEVGTLIYVKAAIHGDEPEDISSYAASNSTFPHESTVDQFFSESQFESYRRLGLHIGLAVFGEPPPGAGHAADLATLAYAHIESHRIGRSDVAAKAIG
jgi:predicted acylesterase/phospholipase RssA